MTIEIFTGTPEALQVRLAAIVAMPATINDVITTHNRGTYIILWT